MVLMTWQEACNLAHRFEQGELFRHYVRKRVVPIAAIGLVMLLTSVACAAAIIILFAGISAWLALAGIVLAPLVLFASLFVQAYVFFSWLEDRSLARAGRRAAQYPDIPWKLAAPAFLLPLALLVVIAPAQGLALVALQIAGPLLYARYDR